MSIVDIYIGEAGYGKKVVLHDNHINIEEGKVSAFIGPNGAGKSTLLKAIVGLVKVAPGEILIAGVNIENRSPEKNIKSGISYVPQGNRVFMDLTVSENLELGGFLISSRQELKKRIEEVLTIFPSLAGRLSNDAGDLSGGEKQQLALARALIPRPKILLLDEPSLGLSPHAITVAFKKIREINHTFNTTILVVEQKVREVLKIADVVHGLRMGRIVFTGTPEELQEGSRLQEIFLL